MQNLNMAQEIQTLIEMGFSKEKAERALAVTNNKGVEPAMEWLLAHADEDIGVSTSSSISEAVPAPPSSLAESAPAASSAAEVTAAAAESTSEAEAKSLKCDECGKLFKSNDEVEFHAAKSGHNSFSESTEEKKPLTEEERKEQLAKLEERMRQKRKEREEREKAEELEREKARIRCGREMQDAKLKLQEAEVAKMLEQRRRDKQEEQAARERVRRQIEQDKLARKQAASGGAPPAEVAPTAPAPVAPLAKVSYDQTRIQLRLPDGRSIAQTFSANEQLAAVRLYLQLQASELAAEGFRLMTTFPKKVFQTDDYDKPLESLGLVPSAVIIVAKGQ